MAGEQIIILAAILITLTAIIWFSYRWHRERRSLWLGVSFLAAAGSVLGTVEAILLYFGVERGITAASAVAVVRDAIVFVVALLFPIVVVLAFFLTGIRLIKREVFPLTDALSLGAGALCVFYLVAWPLERDIWQDRWSGALYVYLSFVMIFTAITPMVYTITNALNLIPHRKQTSSTKKLKSMGIQHS
jgi:membrane-bound ClpP family serine protease